MANLCFREHIIVPIDQHFVIYTGGAGVDESAGLDEGDIFYTGSLIYTGTLSCRDTDIVHRPLLHWQPV